MREFSDVNLRRILLVLGIVTLFYVTNPDLAHFTKFYHGKLSKEHGPIYAVLSNANFMISSRCKAF